jgi:Tat protein translocase TatB subunit
LLSTVSRWNSRAFGAKTVPVFNLGMGEIVVVLVVALIFLGPKMLPEIATGLGKVIREIRKATADIRQDIELDDMIRKPLQELRDAATLPPEELKRRDEARAAQRKAAEEEAKRKLQENKAAEEAKQEAQRKEQEAEAEAQRQQRANEELAKAAAALPKPSSPSDVVSAGGTMIANPPPSDNLGTLTPLPEMHSPPPVMIAPRPRLPPPPLPRPVPPSAKPAVAADATGDATMIDVQAQLKAAATAQATVTPRPTFASRQTQPIQPQKRPPEGKKD